MPLVETIAHCAATVGEELVNVSKADFRASRTRLARVVVCSPTEARGELFVLGRVVDSMIVADSDAKLRGSCC